MKTTPFKENPRVKAVVRLSARMDDDEENFVTIGSSMNDEEEKAEDDQEALSAELGYPDFFEDDSRINRYLW